MAGHSKWANIQHRKGRQDEKRGKIWTRIIREIMVAARQGLQMGTLRGFQVGLQQVEHMPRAAQQGMVGVAGFQRMARVSGMS